MTDVDDHLNNDETTKYHIVPRVLHDKRRFKRPMSHIRLHDEKNHEIKLCVMHKSHTTFQLLFK